MHAIMCSHGEKINRRLHSDKIGEGRFACGTSTDRGRGGVANNIWYPGYIQYPGYQILFSTRPLLDATPPPITPPTPTRTPRTTGFAHPPVFGRMQLQTMVFFFVLVLYFRVTAQVWFFYLVLGFLYFYAWLHRSGFFISAKEIAAQVGHLKYRAQSVDTMGLIKINYS